MTLIAVHATDDHAEIVTDTLSYTATQRHLRRTSKVLLVPHLDAALTTHGSAEFSTYWEVKALRLGAVDFDEFLDKAPVALREVWEELTMIAEHRNAIHGGNRLPPRSTAICVGYSPAQGRFRAVGFSTDTDFAPDEIDGVWVVPSPLHARPSDFELARIDELFGQLLEEPDKARGALRCLPPLEPPESVLGWRTLAVVIRRTRALADMYSGLKMYVGGDVIHTRLERGLATQRRIHTFDDTGEEFARMMAGSLHPAGQLGACSCGSGRRLVECCLEAIYADPCPCGSGSRFADCCRVTVEDATTR